MAKNGKEQWCNIWLILVSSSTELLVEYAKIEAIHGKMGNRKKGNGNLGHGKWATEKWATNLLLTGSI